MGFGLAVRSLAKRIPREKLLEFNTMLAPGHLGLPLWGFACRPAGSWCSVPARDCCGSVYRPPPGRVGLQSLQICAADCSCWARTFVLLLSTGLEGLVWRKREGAFLEFMSQDLQRFALFLHCQFKRVLFYCRNSLWWQI